MKTLEAHQHFVTCIAFNTTTPVVATGSVDQVRQWPNLGQARLFSSPINANVFVCLLKLDAETLAMQINKSTRHPMSVFESTGEDAQENVIKVVRVKIELIKCWWRRMLFFHC